MEMLKTYCTKSFSIFRFLGSYCRQIYTIYTYIESMLDETKTTTTTLLIGYCVRV